jgi:hypothetical protein
MTRGDTMYLAIPIRPTRGLILNQRSAFQSSAGWTGDSISPTISIMPTRPPRKSSFGRPALRHCALNLPAVIVFMITFDPVPIIYYSSSLRSGDFDGQFREGGFHAAEGFAGP